MHPRNSRQHKLLDSTAVAENYITGGVGEVTGVIPLPRPDQTPELMSLNQRRNLYYLITRQSDLLVAAVAVWPHDFGLASSRHPHRYGLHRAVWPNPFAFHVP